MSRVPWILGVILLVGTLLGAGVLFNNQNPNDAKKSVSREDPLPPKVISLGFVDAYPGVAKLYPVQTGRLVEVIAEGQPVKKGDVLLRLDDRLAQFKKVEAEAALNDARDVAKNLPAQQKAELEGQEESLKGAQALLAKTVAENSAKRAVHKDTGSEIAKTTIQAMDEAEKMLAAKVKGEQVGLAYLTNIKQPQSIRRADADVQAKQAQFDQADLAVKECTVLAPSDGTVLRVYVHPGEMLGPNPQAPAIEFAPSGSRIIRAEVLQEWAREVRAGQTVTIEDDSHHEKGEEWQGRVKDVGQWFGPKQRVILEPFMVNDVRTMQCLIEVTSEGPRPLIIGQRVRVSIDTTRK